MIKAIPSLSRILHSSISLLAIFLGVSPFDKWNMYSILQRNILLYHGWEMSGIQQLQIKHELFVLSTCKESVRSSMTHRYGHSLLPMTPLHIIANHTSIIKFIFINMEFCT